MSYHMIPTVDGLNYKERLVLDALCHFANNDTKECYPSQKTISEWAGINIKTVIYAINSLKEKGIIKTKKTRTTLIYTIIFDITVSVSSPVKGRAKTCSPSNGSACSPSNGRETRLIELKYITPSKKEGRNSESIKPKKHRTLTIPVEDILFDEYKTLETNNYKIVRDTVEVRRKMIKNSLTFFDNDIEWVKAYIKRAIQDSYVVRQCYSAKAIFGRITIQKYLRDTKPVRYSEKAPEYVPTEADRAFEAMTPDERAAWIRREKKRIRDEMEARK